MSSTQSETMLPTLTAYWWALLFRGIAAVLFGLAAIFWPGLTLFTLIVFFGAYTLVDGIFAIAAGLRDSGGRRWLLLADGVLGALVGLFALFSPGVTALVFLYVIAAWAILTGVLKVVMAVWLRREIDNEWAMALSGVLWVLLGIVLAVMPGVGVLSFTWLIGVFALGAGLTYLVLAFRVRGQTASGRVT